MPIESAESSDSTFQASADESEADAVADDFPNELPAVDEVWSRWAEWKQPLRWAGACIAAAILIAIGGVWIPTLIFMIGMAYGSYHIVITLEIPVRVTPEHAVREFYLAINHWLPNYNRMYKLLTTPARRSTEFFTFSEFRGYWRDKIGRILKSSVWVNTLDFRIEGYKCRYNPEKNMAAVRYTVRVFPNTRMDSGQPVAEFAVCNTAVKGPDGQWYLNDGRIPESKEPLA